MSRNMKPQAVCQICNQTFRHTEVMHGEMVRPSIAELIRKEKPEWSESGFICFKDLNAFRAKQVRDLFETETGEVATLESQVAKSIEDQELLSRNLNETFEAQASFSDQLADRMAAFGGSWRFILLFAGVIVVWIIVNTVALLSKSFDPYPYILLNLVLSCVAALQAPVIMMSQNRQESKDRLRSEHDYRVNLKAELEIRNLHEKVDHLLIHQWRRMVEIQQMQLDLLTEVRQKP